MAACGTDDPMHLRPVVVASLVIAACGGSTEPPSTASNGIGPDSSASPPAPSASTSPSAATTGDGAAPPAPTHTGRETTDAVSPSSIPPAFRPMFEKGRSFRLNVHEEVDPHGPDGGTTSADGTAECAVETVQQVGDALASEIGCDLEGDSPSFESVAFVWSSARRQLWVTVIAPIDEAMLEDLLKTDATFDAQPKPATRKVSQPGMHEGEVDVCTVETTVAGDTVCSDERCEVKTGYGNTQRRVCFSANKGLVELDAVNLSGPRTLRYRLAP